MKRKTYISAVCLLASVFGGSLAANAVADEATCSSPKATAAYRQNSPQPAASGSDVTWKVTYTRSSTAANATLNVTGFYKQVGTGSWTSSANDTWQLNYGPRGETSSPLRGNLAALQLRSLTTPLKADTGIRLVAPDGGCAVQLAYPDGLNVAAFSTISVVGDSLIQDNTVSYLKFFAALTNPVWKVHVDAKNGARWANYPDVASLPLLDQADRAMIDELRGAGRNIFVNNALVIALGANDVGYATASGNGNLVTTRIHNVLKELQAVPQCVVLVSPPSATYDANFNANAEIAEQLYVYAALGGVQGVDPAKIRVVGFSSLSKSHGVNSASPWFVFDSLHLNEAGAQNYAAEIIKGVNSCGK